jgi:hypothetical protein
MNNPAEFLASVVTILFAHHVGDIEDEGVVLALTDNCSCAAWLHQNNVGEQRDPLRAEIAQKIAKTCIDNNFVIHPQHVPGKENRAANDLSRKFDMTVKHLTQSISSICYLQAPKNFQDLPSTRRHFLMDLLVGSTETTVQNSISKGHTDFKDLALSRWLSFTDQAGLAQDIPGQLQHKTKMDHHPMLCPCPPNRTLRRRLTPRCHC